MGSSAWWLAGRGKRPYWLGATARGFRVRAFGTGRFDRIPRGSGLGAAIGAGEVGKSWPDYQRGVELLIDQSRYAASSGGTVFAGAFTVHRWMELSNPVSRNGSHSALLPH